MGSLRFFIDLILPAALWSWGSAQPLTELGIGDIAWEVKAAGDAKLLTFMCRLSGNCGILNLLEPSGLVQECTGIALPLPF